MLFKRYMFVNYVRFLVRVSVICPTQVVACKIYANGAIFCNFSGQIKYKRRNHTIRQYVKNEHEYSLSQKY